MPRHRSCRKREHVMGRGKWTVAQVLLLVASGPLWIPVVPSGPAEPEDLLQGLLTKRT